MSNKNNKNNSIENINKIIQQNNILQKIIKI